MKFVRPKKFLGQHFLKDSSVAQSIADTVDACPKLPILEVGPGMGVLTQFLIGKQRPLKVVEIDFDSVAYLRLEYPELEENIIEDDFLQLHLQNVFEGQSFVFNPPPKVKSAVIRLTRNATQDPGCDEHLLRRVVKATFNQRRKMMRGSLKPLLVQIDAETSIHRDHSDFLAQPLLTRRPEQLSVAEFVALTNAIAQETLP